MKKFCLIGLGTITKRYLKGISESGICLLAVSDIDENAVSREYYSKYPFYSDYKEMISREHPDGVIISTPPKTHFEIASYCLDNNVNVIIEKPVTLCIKEFDIICKKAEEKGLYFKTLFHWQGGIETRAFAEEYDINLISKIKVNVCDPYSNDGETINPDRRCLCGTWIDSGVNILSMIKMWFPFEKTEIISTKTQKCKESGLPIYASVNLMIDGVEAEITVDWTKHRDQKESFVTVGDKTVYINHSAQSITDGKNTTEYGRMERLDEHYYSQFCSINNIENTEQSRQIHKLLLEVNEVL